jgi:type I restriction enzyme S subunit
MSDLPSTWRGTRIGEVFDKIVDGSHNPPAGASAGLPMLSARNILNNGLDLTEIRRLAERQFWEENRRTQASPGDVLLTIVGSIGRSYALSAFDGPLVFQRSVAVLHPVELSAKFCSYQFQSPNFQRQLEEKARGTAQKGVYLGTLSNLSLRVAPLEEQDRIASEIDKQFTRLDAATAALKRVQTNLKRCRSSVLKAACEGRLVPTEAELARKEGRDYEAADMLIQRILRERRARWEADTLAKMQASGKPPQDDRWKQKYKEPSAPDTSNVPALPEGWCWSSLDQLAFVQGGITKGQKRTTEKLRPVPYLRVANVQRGYLDLSEIKEIEATEEEIDQLKLCAGDVLFNEGGDRDKLGRGWIWENQLPLCIHQNHVFRARMALPEIEPRFVSFYANAFGQQYFFDEGKHTTNLASLSMTNLRALPVPIPPAAEQTRIVQVLAATADAIERQQSVLCRANMKAAGLRNSVLASAFTGQLVPQDPTDEPASVLLERIRAGRVESSKKTAARNVARKRGQQ